MGLRFLTNLTRDNETGELSGKCNYSRLNLVLGKEEETVNSKSEKVSRKLDKHGVRQVAYEESNSSLAFSTSHEPTVSEQGQSKIDELTYYSSSSLNPAPICRQFWKAGNYDPGQVSSSQLKRGRNHIQVHPMFLHSNATSHKWVFGAVAELIDNAVDEVQNGATLVIIDKTINPQNRSPALLVQDDGGGMDPESLKRCMSFGFSDKKMKSAIGQYGNGFKTSSMRLGADAIVFTRNLKDRMLTQSVGLLSYTFLRQTCHHEVVIPMVDYLLDLSTEIFRPIFFHGQDHFSSNLSMLLQWSPYSTEEMLIKQFDDIGPHGTKVVVYNLWFNDDGDMELDFDTDVEDIRVRADPKLLQADCYSKPVADQHIAYLYRYSLRVYSSILYLQLPQSFEVVLRGRVVKRHSIARDLKYPEVIQYKPHVGNKEATIITTIGFLKEAPRVNIHGFNVYHKNRLILNSRKLVNKFVGLAVDDCSFKDWRVAKSSNGSARGVVGVLEANFVQPTHNKQDFEKTSLFQKLEARLKQMTMEYWYYHCGLIGYQQAKKSSPVPKPFDDFIPSKSHSSEQFQPLMLDDIVTSIQGENSKRKEQNPEVELAHRKKRHRGSSPGSADSLLNREKQQPTHGNEDELQGGKITNPMQENRCLRAELSELERREKEFNMKVRRLKGELGDVQFKYARLLIESKAMDTVVDC